jgi:hypothetical protein
MRDVTLSACMTSNYLCNSVAWKQQWKCCDEILMTSGFYGE